MPICMHRNLKFMSMLYYKTFAIMLGGDYTGMPVSHTALCTPVGQCKHPFSSTNPRDETDSDAAGDRKAWHDGERTSVDGVVTAECNEDQVESEESFDQNALTNRQAVMLWIEYRK